MLALNLVWVLVAPGAQITWPRKHSILVDTTAQHADRVACRALREVGVEHADSGDDGLLGLLAAAQDLDLIALLDDALLDTACAHGSSARDGEHVLDGQQEGLVRLALRGGDVIVHGLHELKDLVDPLVITWERKLSLLRVESSLEAG